MPNKFADQTAQLECFFQVSEHFRTANDVETILHTTTNSAIELTNSQAGFILLPKGGQLEVVASSAAWPLKGDGLPIQDSFSGWVYRNSLAKKWTKVQNGHDHLRSSGQTLGFKMNNILAVPLTFKGETLGVLEVINKSKDTKFTDEDQFALEFLALLAAMAIRSEQPSQNAKRVEKELIEIDRLKTNFIAIASHEFRTPLGLIMGHAAYLNDMIDDTQYKEQVDVIIRSAERLKKVVEDLSKLESFQSGQLQVQNEYLDLHTLIKEVMVTYEKAALKKQLSLIFEFTDDSIKIFGEAEKIKTAIGHIFDNAIAFTKPGGYIRITTEQVPGYAKVSIIDNGIGIPAKDLNHIFENFFQVEDHLTRHHGGMGLGLAVAKAMITSHGGLIWVESREGQGSAVSFLLPLNEDEPILVKSEEAAI
jgi:signal transduction histidine kinase